MANGYTSKYTPRHPRASASGDVAEHVLVAERALGRFLPHGAQVHHVDGNKKNNSNRNLVICQDGAYHKLLHIRARILRAGGNPNTEAICSTCKIVKSRAEFNKRSGHGNGLQTQCRECSKRTFREWDGKRKRAA